MEGDDALVQHFLSNFVGFDGEFHGVVSEADGWEGRAIWCDELWCGLDECFMVQVIECRDRHPPPRCVHNCPMLDALIDPIAHNLLIT